MKKKIRNLLVYVLVGVLVGGSICTFPVHATDIEVDGDVNRDGTVDVRDLVRLKKYCADENVSIDRKQADWDGSGTINSDDVARLRRWLAGYTAENAPVGLETNIFSVAHGTLNVVETETFPEVTFSNSSNKETTDIIIDDSKFFDELTMYDAISFKLKYAPEDGTLLSGAKGLAVSVVLGETVIKSASAMTENSWMNIILTRHEMDSYRASRTDEKQLCIRLTATKNTTYKYQLELKDFCVADELYRFNCEKTSGEQYGTMSDGAEVPAKTYPFAASCYTNGRYDKWSFISIEDSDYQSSITQYDSIEFDAMIRTPEVGEFASVQLDMVLGEPGAEIPLEEPFDLEYDEWLHISLSPNSIYQYRDLLDETSLKLRLTVVGVNEKTVNTTYELYIRNFHVVKDGNKENFKNAENMFAHWYKEELTQTYFSSEYGSVAPIQGTVGDRTGEFTKYQNAPSSIWSFITIHDELFKQGFTAEDSIRFYVYAEKNEDFDKESVSLALVDNSTPERGIKGDMTLPFGEWTLVTMNGEEVQKYLDANNGLRIRMTTRPDTASEHLGYVLYLTDIEVLKLANADVTTDMLTVTRGDGTIEAGVQNHGLYSGSYTTYVNVWEWYPKIKIDDSKIKEVIEDGDSLEFWVYMEHNNGDKDGQASFGLSTMNDDTPIGGQTTLVQDGRVWTKITLDAEGVRKYLAADDGLKIFISMEVGLPHYKLTIGELAVVKKVELQTITNTYEEPLVAAPNMVHGAYESVSAQYTNGYWNMWSYISVDDSDFKNNISKYDAVEFWVYASGVRANVETLSLAILSENKEFTIKEKVILTGDTWTQVKLTPEEVAAYIQYADGMKFLLSAEGETVWDEGGTDYTLYIDEFQVITDGYYDEVTALEKYQCTNNTSAGTFAVDYDIIRGTDNRCSAAFTNHQDSRCTFITIDDTTFCDKATKDTVIKLWAYLKPSENAGCDYSSITLSVGTNTETSSILEGQELTFNKWNEICLSGEAMEQYLAKQAGLRLCVTVVGGSDMSYVLYLEDFRVMQASDAVSGNLSVVDVYVADSSDKVLRDEDCSYLGSDFSLTAYRNEYESGQLILTSTKDVSGFTVSATDFVCEDATLSAELFEIYTEYYHEVDLIYDTESKQSVGMYPDALIPMETAAKFGLNRVLAGENQGIWIAVKIPETQQAGTYTGKFRLTLGGQTKEVPAQVTVVDYTLPSTVSLQSCIPIQPAYIGLGEMDYSDEIYAKYVGVLDKFRLSGQYVSKMSTDPDGYQRGLEEAKATLEYAQKESCSSYAIRVVETEDDTYTWVLNQGLLEKYLQAYIDVSIEEQVDLFKKAYIYMGQIIDEPVINGLEARAQYVSMQINDAVKNALTYLDSKSCDADFHAQLKQSLSELQHVVTADKIEELSAVNTYCPMIDAFDSSLDTEKRKEAGNYWWYTCTLPKVPYPTYHIDDEAASARIMGWLARENGVKGYLTWEVIYPYDAAGNTIHGVDWYDNVHRWYDAYGDGFLVYPGRIFDVDTPIQSLRLYAMCDGMEDYEALADLENRYQELAEQYHTPISADGILDYVYDLLADNTRCYGDGEDIANAREILTQLLMLAQEGTAISDFYVEDGKAHYKVVKATGITEGTYTFESAVMYTFASYIPTSNVTVTTEDDMKAATVEGQTEYSVVFRVSKDVVTKTTDRMYLTVYNDSSETISVKVYSNQTEYMDTFLLKPGKNILSFAQMQQLQWFPRKGMTYIEFKLTTPDTSRVKMRFGKITKWD